MALKGRRRQRRFGSIARGTRRFNVRRLTPRRKARIERRRRRFFESELDFDRVRRNNKKRALYATHIRGKTKIYERYPKGRTIIDVAKILKKNTNGSG